MAMDGDGEWLSRNPPKRGRRSYDNQWSTYEARGSGRSGGQPSWRGGGHTGLDSLSSRRGDNITAEGERAGISHDQYPRQGGMAASSGQTSVMAAGGRFHEQHPRQGGAAVAGITGQASVASGRPANNPYGNSASSSRGVANSSARGSRIRVADYRGAAARVGNLPLNDGPPPSIFQSDSSFRGGRGGNESANGSGLSQNAQFMKSLAHPPPLTASLPPALRSTLNKEQCRVVESVLSGHSTFFTGPAGSGKSHILSTLIAANEQGVGGMDGRPRKIVVTATTGVAACNVGGVTIHSFSGAGMGKGSPADLAKRVMGNEYSKTRWREVDILVIDEISMMAGSFLEKLSFIASRARGDRRPFGGVQLVVCGDFFQLPPVDLNKDSFAFETECWSNVIKCSVLLKQVFRQRGDATLMNILDEARTGELSAASAAALKRHSTLPAAAFSAAGQGGDDAERMIIPTLLECRNRDVDKANVREMAKLPGETHTFTSRDRAMNDSMKAQLKHCAAPPQLDLKVGAQVMLLKNLDLEKGLANGSRGVVVGFQRPTSDSCKNDPPGFKNRDLPVVKFDSVRAVGNDKDLDDPSTDGNDNEFIVHPEEWTNKMGDQTVSSRAQIPLRPAWSISVHKSQGMTIPNLSVNLSGVFEYGQAYVALSRATELKLLTLRGFSARSFKAHPKVKAFYDLLDGGSPNSSGHFTNKENAVAQQYTDIGDLGDPFEDGSCTNPHSQRKRGSSLSPNPYQQPQRQSQPQGSSFSTNPYQQPQRQMQPQGSNPYRQPQRQMQGVSPRPQPAATNNTSHTLTQDQRLRMEENRRRAIAIRTKKQNGSSLQ